MITRSLDLNKYDLALIRDALRLQKESFTSPTLKYDCTELIDIARNAIDEIEAEEQEEKKLYPIECNNCAGSGEGSHDGSTCIVCNGSGNI